MSEGTSDQTSDFDLYSKELYDRSLTPEEITKLFASVGSFVMQTEAIACTYFDLHTPDEALIIQVKELRSEPPVLIASVQCFDKVDRETGDMQDDIFGLKPFLSITASSHQEGVSLAPADTHLSGWNQLALAGILERTKQATHETSSLVRALMQHVVSVADHLIPPTAHFNFQNNDMHVATAAWQIATTQRPMLSVVYERIVPINTESSITVTYKTFEGPLEVTNQGAHEIVLYKNGKRELYIKHENGIVTRTTDDEATEDELEAKLEEMFPENDEAAEQSREQFMKDLGLRSLRRHDADTIYRHLGI